MILRPRFLLLPVLWSCAALACTLAGVVPAPGGPPTTTVVAEATASPTTTPLPPTETPPATPPLGPVISAGTIDRILPLRTLVVTQNEVKRVAFSLDGEYLAATSGGNSTSTDYTVRVFRVADAKLVRSLEGHTGIVWDVAFSPDGRWIATGSDDRTVRLWPAAQAGQEATLQVDGAANSLAFSPDGALLAVGVAAGGEGTLVLYRMADMTLLGTFAAHPYSIPAMAFSPDGTTLATLGTVDRTVRLWRVAGVHLASARKLSMPSEGGGLAVAPDGTRAAASVCLQLAGTTCTEGQAWMWRLADGIRRVTFLGPAGRLGALSFSPDGSLLAAGSEQGEVWVWDATTGELIRKLSAQEGFVESVAFSPDGRYLASAADGTVVFWGVRL